MDRNNQEPLKCTARGLKRRTILFVCTDATGHVHSVMGMANYLREQGHRTVFLFQQPFANGAKQFGHEVYDCSTPDLVESPSLDVSKPNLTIQMVVSSGSKRWSQNETIDGMESIVKDVMPEIVERFKPLNQNVARKMELLKPDILVIDHFFMYPALYKLNIPWVRVFSAGPLILHDYSDDLPEAWLGLPTKWNKNDPIQREWNERAKKARQKFHNEVINPYWTSFGFPDLPTNPISFFPISPYLNMYMYSQELDYEQPLVGWERYESSVRARVIKKFELPEKLRDKPGKLIFLSMGSIASSDVELMKRLTSMLADCPHRFIVVTGTGKDKYELPDNMWGDVFLPQIDILNAIDLIITHGGNNTITESLYYGVPGMIVCPLFGDQPDNAQRVHETGLGIRLDPYHCSKAELHGAIEQLINRPDLSERIKQISRRMQQPETSDKPLKLIGEFVSRYS